MESQEWRANLSEEEAALVAKWDEDYACGLTKLYGELSSTSGSSNFVVDDH